jgi:hypothetical protein
MGPALEQEPLWMWLACCEFAFMPVSVSLTVNEPASFVMIAVPVTPLAPTACIVTEMPEGLGETAAALGAAGAGEEPLQASETTAARSAPPVARARKAQVTASLR